MKIHTTQTTETTESKSEWYDNRVVVNLLIIAFFPAGIYGLWKSKRFALWWKITAPVLVILTLNVSISKRTIITTTTKTTTTVTTTTTFK